AIVAEELGAGVVHRFELVDLVVQGGTQTTPTAHVVLADGDTRVEADGTGNGMVDAACTAIATASGITGRVLDFKVSSVTSGRDALGDVVIQLEADGRAASGRGVSTDIVEASARAYLSAVNKLVRARGEAPRERTVGP
ncbi:MAG: alpha-isopropylmalate synthase regulatory domain-containing protein, partial [Actinomycetota bacterium]